MMRQCRSATCYVLLLAPLGLASCRAGVPPKLTLEPPAATDTTSPPTSAPTPTSIPPTDTLAPHTDPAPEAEVVMPWLAAWNTGDLEAFMALLAEDAVLDRGPYGVIAGLDAIRAVVAEELKEGLKGRLSDIHVAGDEVFYHHEVLLHGQVVDQGSAGTIAREGKIISDLPAP